MTEDKTERRPTEEEPDYCPYSDNQRGNCAECPYWYLDEGPGCHFPDPTASCDYEGDEIKTKNKDPRGVLFPII